MTAINELVKLKENAITNLLRLNRFTNTIYIIFI